MPLFLHSFLGEFLLVLSLPFPPGSKEMIRCPSPSFLPSFSPKLFFDRVGAPSGANLLLSLFLYREEEEEEEEEGKVE